MSVIAISEVKLRLNKSLTTDDAEIQAMLDAAEAEYAEWVGPLSGSVVEVHDGGQTSIVLRASNVTALTAATYSDGSVLTLSELDLDVRTGIVHWDYNTAGAFTYGNRNVTITATVGALPANHREAIIADVAGYFEATQRGPAGLPGDGYESAFTSTPQTLFPRIRALAPPRIA